jgi:hypothetical protein
MNFFSNKTTRLLEPTKNIMNIQEEKVNKKFNYRLLYYIMTYSSVLKKLIILLVIIKY